MKFYSILLSGLYGRPPLDSTQRFVLLVKAQRRSSARPSVSGSSHGHEWYFLSCSTDLRIRTFHCLQTIVGHLQTNNGFDDRSKEKKENADNHPRRIVAEKRLTALDNPRTVQKSARAVRNHRWPRIDFLFHFPSTLDLMVLHSRSQFLFAFLSVSSHSNPRIILKNSSLVC